MGFLDGPKQDLIEFVRQGQQLVVIYFYDEWNFVRVLASHAAEHAERRGDTVTAAFNRQLHDIFRIEILRIRSERSAGRVLDTLIDGKNGNITGPGEAPVINQRLQRSQD